MRGRAPLAGFGVILVLLAGPAQAGSAADGDLELLSIGMFATPIYVAAPPSDGERVFVVEQGGRIRLVRAGTLSTPDFLDITTLVLSGGERGLFSMAFAPDYATSGRFYVYYTAQDPAGELTIAEYRRSANPDVAEVSGRIVLSIPHPVGNHNGGQLQFGPDGYLYIATGDGGGGGDPDRNGQNLDSLLGKLLRIDPRLGPNGEPYTIPTDNPFVGQTGARAEIWSYGLRNPWRFSFDRLTGDLTVGDVGQGSGRRSTSSLRAPGPAGRRTSAGAVSRVDTSMCRTRAARLFPPSDQPHPACLGVLACPRLLDRGGFVRDPELTALLGAISTATSATTGVVDHPAGSGRTGRPGHRAGGAEPVLVR